MVLKSFLRVSAEERPEWNGDRNLIPGPSLLLRYLAKMTLFLSGDHVPQLCQTWESGRASQSPPTLCSACFCPMSQAAARVYPEAGIESSACWWPHVLYALCFHRPNTERSQESGLSERSRVEKVVDAFQVTSPASLCCISINCVLMVSVLQDGKLRHGGVTNMPQIVSSCPTSSQSTTSVAAT